MCGRYTYNIFKDDVRKRFKIYEIDIDPQSRFNIAPSQNIPVVYSNEDEKRILTEMKWGLIPFWAKDPSIGNRMINARVETIAEKPSFKRALTKRRCLILADGFYEWKKNGKTKTPMRVTLKGEKPFAFAGLWDSWKDPKSEIEIKSCTIVTCASNSFMKNLHHRMPVILKPKTEDLWLDLKIIDPAKLVKLLVPYPSKEMTAYAVSTAVNSPRNEGEYIIKKTTC